MQTNALPCEADWAATQVLAGTLGPGLVLSDFGYAR
jgi:hypothetical protein